MRIHVIGRERAGEVLLSIEDEGAGFHGDRVAPFDAFAQFKGNDRTGGTGLGLAIVKAFADALGIDVSASNRDPHGAAFTLRFPKNTVLSEKVDVNGD